MLWVVGAVVSAGCGSDSKGTEVEACNRMATLCGDQVSVAEVRECASEWPEFRKQFGEDTANRFSKCAREAKSCPEVIGCAAGVVGRLGKDFERGMDKMFDDDDEPAKSNTKRNGDDTTESHTDKSSDSHTEKSTESHSDKSTESHTDTTDSDPFNEGPLPPECRRADEVCDKDEYIARSKCRRMVGNLKADPEHMKELATCYADAKNCFAFKKCSSDMWFKLN